MRLSVRQQVVVHDVARKYGVTLVVVYGSVVSGETHAESDVDLAIMTKDKPDGKLYQDLYRDLAPIFSGQPVDIRFMNDADPLFLMQVVKNGVLVYGDKDKFDDLKIYANRRYVDDGQKYFPYRELLLKENQELLRKAAA